MRRAPLPLCEALESRQLLAADLTAVSLSGKFPPAAVSGGSSLIRELKLKVRNTGDVSLANTGSQKTVFRVYASTDAVLDLNDIALWETDKKLNLKPGKTTTIAIKAGQLPGSLDGEYQFIALADATDVFAEFDENNNVAANPAKVVISEPFSSLDSLKVTLPESARNGKQVTYKLQVQNIGNSRADGDVTVTLQFIPDGGGSVTELTDTIRIKLDANKSKAFSGKIDLPLLTPGRYTYTLNFTPVNAELDADLADNLVAGTRVLKVKS